MKKKLFITILFLCLELLHAQENKIDSTEMDTIHESITNIPFTLTEEAPIFPGCENLNLDERIHCLNRSMQNHVVRKFNSSVADPLGLPKGYHKIFISFRINEMGLPDSIKVKAPHLVLKKEAIRVVKALPKIIPGKLKGKNISVKYALPISFYVKKPNRKKKNKRY